MPKKSKRKVSQVSRPSVASETAPEAIEAAAAGASTIRSSFSRRTTTTEFNPDYSYVVKDLKRIGLLAGTFFVILIVLSFFIH